MSESLTEEAAIVAGILSILASLFIIVSFHVSRSPSLSLSSLSRFLLRYALIRKLFTLLFIYIYIMHPAPST